MKNNFILALLVIFSQISSVSAGENTNSSATALYGLTTDEKIIIHQWEKFRADNDYDKQRNQIKKNDLQVLKDFQINLRNKELILGKKPFDLAIRPLEKGEQPKTQLSTEEQKVVNELLKQSEESPKQFPRRNSLGKIVITPSKMTVDEKIDLYPDLETPENLKNLKKSKENKIQERTLIKSSSAIGLGSNIRRQLFPENSTDVINKAEDHSKKPYLPIGPIRTLKNAAKDLAENAVKFTQSKQLNTSSSLTENSKLQGINSNYDPETNKRLDDTQAENISDQIIDINMYAHKRRIKKKENDNKTRLPVDNKDKDKKDNKTRLPIDNNTKATSKKKVGPEEPADDSDPEIIPNSETNGTLNDNRSVEERMNADTFIKEIEQSEKPNPENDTAEDSSPPENNTNEENLSIDFNNNFGIAPERNPDPQDLHNRSESHLSAHKATSKKKVGPEEPADDSDPEIIPNSETNGTLNDTQAENLPKQVIKLDIQAIRNKIKKKGKDPTGRLPIDNNTNENNSPVDLDDIIVWKEIETPRLSAYNSQQNRRKNTASNLSTNENGSNSLQRNDYFMSGPVINNAIPAAKEKIKPKKGIDGLINLGIRDGLIEEKSPYLSEYESDEDVSQNDEKSIHLTNDREEENTAGEEQKTFSSISSETNSERNILSDEEFYAFDPNEMRRLNGFFGVNAHPTQEEDRSPHQEDRLNPLPQNADPRQEEDRPASPLPQNDILTTPENNLSFKKWQNSRYFMPIVGMTVTIPLAIIIGKKFITPRLEKWTATKLVPWLAKFQIIKNSKKSPEKIAVDIVLPGIYGSTGLITGILSGIIVNQIKKSNN